MQYTDAIFETRHTFTSACFSENKDHGSAGSLNLQIVDDRIRHDGHSSLQGEMYNTLYAMMILMSILIQGRSKLRMRLLSGYQDPRRARTKTQGCATRFRDGKPADELLARSFLARANRLLVSFAVTISDFPVIDIDNLLNLPHTWIVDSENRVQISCTCLALPRLDTDLIWLQHEG